eukprot:410091_1
MSAKQELVGSATFAKLIHCWFRLVNVATKNMDLDNFINLMFDYYFKFDGILAICQKRTSISRWGYQNDDTSIVIIHSNGNLYREKFSSDNLLVLNDDGNNEKIINQFVNAKCIDKNEKLSTKQIAALQSIIVKLQLNYRDTHCISGSDDYYQADHIIQINGVYIAKLHGIAIKQYQAEQKLGATELEHFIELYDCLDTIDTELGISYNELLKEGKIEDCHKFGHFGEKMFCVIERRYEDKDDF